MSIFTRLRLCWQILWGVPLVGEGETTSRDVARIAAMGLAKPWALNSQQIRTVCASALTQAPDRRGNA